MIRPWATWSFALRRAYLICYDVRHPKRLRKAHRTAKAYGEPWQYSVFYCLLKEIDRVRLEAAMSKVLNLKEDQLLIIDLGQRDEDGGGREGVTTLGPALPEIETGVVVI